MKTFFNEIGQLQKMRAGALFCLERQTDIFFSNLQPVDMQFEGLSVSIHLSEGFINLQAHKTHILFRNEEKR